MTAARDSAQPERPQRRVSWRSRLGNAVQLILALALAGGVLVWLLKDTLWHEKRGSVEERHREPAAVQLIGPLIISVKAGTPMASKLVPVAAEAETISTPTLNVTGSVVAQLRSGDGPAEDRWQFSTSDLLTAYADWRRAVNDVNFAKNQLTKVRELSDARLAAQTEVVHRMRKTVPATDSIKDLRAEEAKLKEVELQGQKDVHEAENTLRVAERNVAALERQLGQGGVDPHLMARLSAGARIVMADVPEAKLGMVEQGRGCDARFYALPGLIFHGKVGSVAPTLTKDRRTLRVLFELSDPQSHLRPGMFADVGLGTDPRTAILVPADAIVHVGRSDYILAAAENDHWRITEVKVGEQFIDRVEIINGLAAHVRVIGSGAILLKPFIVQAVSNNTTSKVGP